MTSQSDLITKAEELGETIKELIPTKTSDLENDKGYISTLPSGSTSQAGIVQIVDNLTTDDNTKVLSAKQGKALSDMIGTAIQYIQQ